MTDDQTAPRRKRKSSGRSPNYPGITLPKALERAQTLYGEEGRTPAPVNVIFDHWGYSPKSGLGQVTLAALKHFGLLEDQGTGQNRTASLTPLALRIIQDQREDSPQRDDAVRQAALTPSIHRELWEKYDGRLPSNATLRFYLVNERGFTENGAEDFVSVFRTTVEYAGLSEGDTFSDGDEDEDREDTVPTASQQVSPPERRHKEPTPPKAGSRILSLPLSPTSWATLQVPDKMTSAEWDQMLAVLAAMKPGIVSEDKSDPEDD